MTSKSKLNLYCQKSRIDVPCYTTEQTEDGFVSNVNVAGRYFKSRVGQTTKKAAEDNAAHVAVEVVVHEHPGATNIDEVIEWADKQWGKKRGVHSQAATTASIPATTIPTPATTVPIPTTTVATPPVDVNLDTELAVSDPRTGIYSPVSRASPVPHDNGVVSSPSSNRELFADGERPAGAIRSQAAFPSPVKTPAIDSAVWKASPTKWSPRTSSKCDSKSKQQRMLEDYCKSHGLDEPKYHVRSERDNFTATVTIGSQEFSPEQKYNDFDEAKDNATCLALAALGIQALEVSEGKHPQLAPFHQPTRPAPFHQPPFHQPSRPAPFHQPTRPAPFHQPTRPAPFHQPAANQYAVTHPPQPTPPRQYAVTHPTPAHQPAVTHPPQPTPPRQYAVTHPTPAHQPAVTHPPQPTPPRQYAVTHPPQPTPPRQYAVTHPTPAHQPAVTHPPQPTPPRQYAVTHPTPAHQPAVTHPPQPTPPRQYAVTHPPQPTPPRQYAVTHPTPAHQPAFTQSHPAQYLRPPSYFEIRQEAPIKAPFTEGRTAQTSTSPSNPSPSKTRTPASSISSVSPAAGVHVETTGNTPSQSQANVQLPPANYKQILNEYCQKNRIPLPQYTCEYPDDIVGYIACLNITGKEFRSPAKSSKKAAELLVAAEAVKSLGIPVPSGQSSVLASTKSPHALPNSAVEDQSGFTSYKNLLQEYAQKQKLSLLPSYSTQRTGEGFQSKVTIVRQSGEKLEITSGNHSTKKAAEQEAARIACDQIGL